MQQLLNHPTAGTVSSVGNPINLSATPVEYDLASPILGQHTDEVLARVLKFSVAQIDRLRQDNIIA